VNFLYRCGWLFFCALFRVYFRGRVCGADNVPPTGPVILAANHASFLDPPFVGSALHRPLFYLARASLFRKPLLGWLLPRWNSIPVDRDGGNAAGLRVIMDRLASGAGIILFPEGTRSFDGNLQPARSGIGLIAAKTDAPVVPVRICGSFEAWGRNCILPRPKPIVVKFGSSMRFESLRAEAKNCSRARLREIYSQIANEIMAAIAKLPRDL